MEPSQKKMERAKKWALDERTTKKLDHIINRIEEVAEPGLAATEGEEDPKAAFIQKF